MTPPTGGRTVVCTVVSKNYLAFARTLMASVAAAHPEWERCVLLADELRGEFDPAGEPFEVVPLDALDLPRPREFCYRYGILELNTAVKPWFLTRLFDRPGVDRVVYLDPDIFVYRPMTEVEAALAAGALMVLTPHLTARITDGRRPGEKEILRSGCYNLGFVALARHPRLGDFLDWWRRKLEFDCRVDLKNGLFVDQKWMDLAPGLFPDVTVLRHDGYNVAYWNLAQRPIRKVGADLLAGGAPLAFMHFSGLNPQAPRTVSKHQDRLTLNALGDGKDLFLDYCRTVLANGHARSRGWPYAFAALAGGRPVTDLMRQFYRDRPAAQKAAGPDPFAAGHEYLNAPWGADREPVVTEYMRAVWEARPDLQRAFPDIDGAWRFDFADAFVSDLAAEEKVPEWLVAPVRASVRRAAADGARAETPDRVADHVGPDGDAEPVGAFTAMLRLVIKTAVSVAPVPRDREAVLRLAARLKPLGRFLPVGVRTALRRELRHWLRRRVALRRVGFFRLAVREVWSLLTLPFRKLTRRTVTPIPDAVLDNDESNPDVLPFRRPEAPPEPGLNVVGYLRSEHGVGESGRRAVLAADAAGVPVSLVDFNRGNASRTCDRSVADRLSDRNPYRVNLLHVNADQMPEARADLGPAFFRDRHTVGHWAWELPSFPARWAGSFDLVDEVWVPSRFVQRAVAAATTKPVLCMPHCVRFATTPAIDRAAFRLPGRDFLFLMMFDYLSIPERKNPEGALDAFRKAFARRPGVALVVKTNNADKAPAAAARLRRRLAGEPGVVLLDRPLARQQVYDLVSVCDAYLSLHRSEGFGLGLAEAMYLGKPVVGTDWSGNTDFMRADNACPVRYRLVQLDRDHGPYEAGQTWAEPDVDHAAGLMARLVDEPDWRADVGDRGRRTIRDEFSPEAVGELYRRRLRQIVGRDGRRAA